MIALFLGVLLVGLLLGVFAMLHGTERVPRNLELPAPHERTSEHVVDTEPSALLNLATVAAFTFTFGLVGYLLSRFTFMSLPLRLVIAAASGGGALALQSLLIARWAIPSARADHVDERYLLQGTIGRITHDVPPDGEGAMQYTLDGRTYTLPARVIDGAPLHENVEVVLERVEKGVAFVEPWAQVEQRL